jgi:hypothetical protein
MKTITAVKCFIVQAPVRHCAPSDIPTFQNLINKLVFYGAFTRLRVKLARFLKRKIIFAFSKTRILPSWSNEGKSAASFCLQGPVS